MRCAALNTFVLQGVVSLVLGKKKTYLTFDNTIQNNINYLDMLAKKCGEIFLFHW